MKRSLIYIRYIFGIVVVVSMALVSGCLEQIADLYTPGSDPKPVYQAPLYSFQLSEGSPSGTTVGRIVVVNSDESEVVGWQFKEGDDAHHFSIAEDGTLRSVEALDFETRRFYTLIAQATNEHERSADIAVHVALDDIDEGPQFSQESYLFEVSELNGLDDEISNDIGLVEAIDPDIFLDLPDGPGIESYAIAEGNDEEYFHIDEHGTISLLKELNFEIQDSYPLVVEAEDRSHITTRVAVTISVINIDEFPPMFGQERYTFGVREDVVRGTVVGRVSAVDPDLRGIENYRIVEGNFIRAGNSVPDLIIDIEGRIVVDVPLDYESLQSYHLRVRARDDDGSETTTNSIVMTDAEVTIEVINLDDELPQFLESSYRFDIAENEGIGTMVGTVLAFDPDFPDDGNAIGYSIVGDTTHPALSFDANTGELMVVNDALLDYEMQQAAEEPLLRFTVMAEDGSGMSSTAEVGIAVGDIVVRGDASIAENVPIDTLVDIALSGPEGASYSIDDITGIIFNNVVDSNGDRVSITDVVTGTIEDSDDNRLRIAQALDYDSAARYELILNTIADSSEGALGVEDVEVTLQIINRVTGGVEITDVSGGHDDGEIDLAWINPDGATFEEVAVSWEPVEGESQPIVIDADAGESDSLTLVGLTPGRTYTIVLTAVYDGGTRIPVSTAQAAADVNPDPIASLVGVAGNRQVRLNWVNPAVNDLMRFDVSVEEVGGGAPIVSQESTQTAADAPVTRIVTGLTNGANYRIGVTAIDNAGNPSGEQVRWVTPYGNLPRYGNNPNITTSDRVPNGEFIFALAVSPNDSLVAWGNTGGEIVVSERVDGALTEVATWRTNIGGGGNDINDLAFSFHTDTTGDSLLLVSAHQVNTIQFWSPRTGSAVATINDVAVGPSQNIRGIAFSPDGTLLASINGVRARIWRIFSNNTLEIDTTPLRTLLGHTDVLMSVAFHPSGEIVATSSRDETIKLWRVSDGSLISTLRGHTDWVNSIAFNPDGTLLASGGGTLPEIDGDPHKPLSATPDYALKLWEVSTCIAVSECTTILREFDGHTEGVDVIAFSPDGRTLASGSLDDTFKLWDITNNSAPIRTVGGTPRDISALAFSRDGRAIIVGGRETIIRTVFWP